MADVKIAIALFGLVTLLPRSSGGMGGGLSVSTSTFGCLLLLLLA